MMPEFGGRTSAPWRPLLAESFQQQWAKGAAPALDEFLAASPEATPADVSAVLRVELRERWRRGERVLVESLLARFPQVAENTEAALDLIFTEFLIREEVGDSPRPDEYALRFAAHAELLNAQIAIHNALNDDEQRFVIAPGASDNSTCEQSQRAEDSAIADEFIPPRRIGRYQTVRVLGRGGMGSVLLARDLLLDRDVALKLPSLSAELGTEVIDRFYREAKAVAKLSHPNLCVIHDVGSENGTPYLAMQFIAGETLDEAVRRRGPLPPRRALEIARQIAAALDVVHQAGVLHRDLKPANVMFNDRDEAIVMDFGLAFLQIGTHPRPSTDTSAATELADTVSNVSAQSLRLTMTGQLLGTPAYAAPEQLSGDVDSFTPACDVYSLGVVLYEMLTGRTPFAGSLADVAWQVQTVPPIAPSHLRTDVPSIVDQLCLRALAKAPDARFESMAAFRTALEQAEEAIELPTRTSRFARHRKLIVALVCLAATCAAIMYGMRSNSPDTQSTTGGQLSVTEVGAAAQTPKAMIIELDPQAPELKLLRQHEWRNRHAFLTGFSPNGQYYWAGGEYFKNEEIRIWETHGGREAMVVRGSYLRFSRDSKTIYSANVDDTNVINCWDLDSKQSLPPFRVRGGIPVDFVISSDGKRFASSDRDSVTIWNVEKREEIRTARFKGCVLPHFSPLPTGNSALVYDIFNTDSQVHLFDMESGEVLKRFIDADASHARLVRGSPDGKEFAIVNRRAISFWKLDQPEAVRRFCFKEFEICLNAKAITRDLKWGLFSTESSPRVYLINLETGKTHGVSNVVEPSFPVFGYHGFSPDGRFAVFCNPSPSNVFVLEMPPEVWQASPPENGM